VKIKMKPKYNYYPGRKIYKHQVSLPDSPYVKYFNSKSAAMSFIKKYTKKNKGKK